MPQLFSTPGVHARKRLVAYLLMCLGHAVIFACSGILGFLLRFDFALDALYLPHIMRAVPVWILVKSAVFGFGRLHLGSMKHTSVRDAISVALVNLVGSIVSGIVIVAVAPPGVPRSVYVLDLLVCLILTIGVRFIVRVSRELWRRKSPRDRKRVLIYGAGDAGVMLLREINRNPALPYDVLGFVDDDPRKHRMLVHRIPVLGRGEEMQALVRRHHIAEVLIAIPSASGPDMARILERSHLAGVACKTMPSLSDFIVSAGAAAQIRDVAVEDLLGRNPVRLDEEQIGLKLQGRVVMVTGAAGSIGSELCRQIAKFHPRAIVAFEIAETALFYLEQEIRATSPDVLFYPVIGSIQNAARVRGVIETYVPSIIYHAAAYKHVPLMEMHIFEAVENNVFGTWNIAKMAAEYGVEDFLMISSDKAVHPTSIMGTTKRVAEQAIYSLQGRGTKYVSVRFGNVLGSAGSVVPIFKKQIAAGGPVKVTHPDMRRYFMTIPEAVQLVLQASTMSSGGEIFVLDMGTPVRIVDLARNLILLSGLRPEHDIRIDFTGVRPGEKLYEEINLLNEDTQPTYHEKIKIFKGSGQPREMTAHLDRLRRCCATQDAPAMLLELKDIVPDFNPGAHLLRQLLRQDAPGLPAMTVQARDT